MFFSIAISFGLFGAFTTNAVYTLNIAPVMAANTKDEIRLSCLAAVDLLELPHISMCSSCDLHLDNAFG
jgi:hypothetical protein